MTQISPRKWFLSALPLTAGLACSQVLGTLYVLQSNLRILEQTRLLTESGWLAVPAGPLVEKLNSFSAAFGGGIFFTLTVGTGLALGTWTIAGLYRKLLYRNRPAALAAALIWLVLLAAVNIHGPLLYPSLFVFLVPLVTAWLAFRYPPEPAGLRHVYMWIVPAVTLAVLTGLWSTQLSNHLFTAIRDRILLSNNAGRAVSDFYYRYTLYAAEPFKSFGQKTIRTCRLTGMVEDRQDSQIKHLLARHDIFVVNSAGPVDLNLTQAESRLSLASAAGDSMEVAIGDFISRPAHWINRFSEISDRSAPFRRLVFAGLLFGFPVLLFTTVYGLLKIIMRIILPDPGATFASSGLCLVIGIVLFVPIAAGKSDPIPVNTIGTTLKSNRWAERVSALRRIDQNQLEIERYDGYRKLLESPLVVERYWLARALAVSRTERTYQDLLKLTSDTHPNVVCQAFSALGRRGRAIAIERIKDAMLSSDHWYVQWYAYRAIRKLGWEQKQFK